MEITPAGVAHVFSVLLRLSEGQLQSESLCSEVQFELQANHSFAKNSQSKKEG
jgi:hypothetical protein